MKTYIKKFLKLFYFLIHWSLTPFWFVVLILICAVTFFRNKKCVGIGPEPLINNKYHKLALQQAGYEAETFVNQVYFITSDFDIRGDRVTRFFGLKHYTLFIRALWKYRIIYIYFNGGPLAWTPLYWCEAFFFKIGGIKSVVMPYGGDVFDILRCPNMVYRNAMLNDYPRFQKENREQIVKRVGYWTRNGDHIIGGCDWVDYLPHWDTLMTAHFSIDTTKLVPREGDRKKVKGSLRVLHAPNHKMIKGTSFFIEAVNSLKLEGYDIDLTLLTKRPNEEVLEEIRKNDVVADQLIIGWHGIFALEAMALGRPTICFLRDDLLDLYHSARLIDRNNLPFINAGIISIKGALKELIEMDNDDFNMLKKNSIEYVSKHHSLQSVGSVFMKINESLGLKGRRI